MLIVWLTESAPIEIEPPEESIVTAVVALTSNPSPAVNVIEPDPAFNDKVELELVEPIDTVFIPAPVPKSNV